MRKTQKQIGNEHVELVHQAFMDLLDNRSIENFPHKVSETVSFIHNLYPNIKAVKSKFQSKSPDKTNDLILTLADNTIINVNLFLVKNKAAIQPKNPGAKSFFSTYFSSDELQELFNISFREYYKEYLNEVVDKAIGKNKTYLTSVRELKKEVSTHYSKFTEEINPTRDKFLYNLREKCFELLKNNFNDKSINFFHAFNSFFMAEDLNIITRYNNNDRVEIEKFNPPIPNFNDIQLYKSGKNTVGINFGDIALKLRFKFESGPSSAIKLATSYDSFPSNDKLQEVNIKTVNLIEGLLAQHEHIAVRNVSDHVGKCHEAYTYYYFLKQFPAVVQVDEKECINILKKHYNYLDKTLLNKIYTSTSTIIAVLEERLSEKHDQYNIESIELVPKSYIDDKLDTGDLSLTLRVNDKIVVEKISLKALKRRGSKLTTKNPGIGTILGPSYFNIGTMKPTVDRVKEEYSNSILNRRESLEVLSGELGKKLSECSQEKLVSGLESLLGSAIIGITFYDENISYCKEVSEIDSKVNVYVQKPSTIQNTLAWNEDRDEISLRVKFSKGESYGWSSIKLASEYTIK
ncbi:MAG: hypothetical protein ACQET6_07525 [Bacillota bacterium]